MGRRCRTIDLAGTCVELWAETPELERYLEWHFGALPDVVGPVDLRVELCSVGRPRPSGPPDMIDGPISRWIGEGDLVLWHEQDVGAQLVDGVLVVGGDAAAGAMWRAVRQLLFSALSWFLDRRGALVLHAAMVGRDGEGLVLLGASGSGKSTAAAAGLLAGWELLSDDLVVVRAGTDVPDAFGIPKRVTVGRQVAERIARSLPELPADDRDRQMLPETVLTTGWRPVRALVRVGHHRSDGEVRALSLAESLADLVPSFLEAERPESLRRQLPLLSALASRPGFLLAHAADPDDRLDRAAALLEEIWQVAGHQ